jgi:hypothetical protein
MGQAALQKEGRGTRNTSRPKMASLACSNRYRLANTAS